MSSPYGAWRGRGGRLHGDGESGVCLSTAQLRKAEREVAGGGDSDVADGEQEHQSHAADEEVALEHEGSWTEVDGEGERADDEAMDADGEECAPDTAGGGEAEVVR